MRLSAISRMEPTLHHNAASTLLVTHNQSSTVQAVPMTFTMAQHQLASQNSATSVTMNDYVQLNVGTCCCKNKDEAGGWLIHHGRTSSLELFAACTA